VGLIENLKIAANRAPDRVALASRRNGVSYGVVLRRVQALAEAWRERGMLPGDRVAWLDVNGQRFYEATFAAAAGGFVLVPLNTRLSATELHGILALAEPKLLGGEHSLLDALGSVDVPRIMRLGGTACEHERAIAGAQPFRGEAAVADTDPAHLYFTSGTTGAPRGVVLTHSNIQVHAVAAMAELGLVASDCWGHFAPMFHLADAWATVAVTLAGGRHVFVPRFGPAHVLDVMESEEVSITNLVPTMLNALVQDPSLHKRSFPRLRRVLSGGAPIAPALVRKVMDGFGCEYVNTYGMTETSPYLTLSLPTQAMQDLNPEEQFAQRARTGRPFASVELRVVRPDMSPVAADDVEVGEIQVRGPTVTPGYWRNPEATSAAFTPDGFLRTGDLARINAFGSVLIVDRMKDVINTGGEKVYTTEVEARLLAHSAVAECVVLGMPSEQWGEEVHAVLVLKSGCDVTAEELREHCRATLSRWKVPKAIHTVLELPRTGSGKLSKRLVRDLLEKGGGSGSASQL
jgi:acyl-CoA synthetase (AMP-forming)/AMP-acid ligase II